MGLSKACVSEDFPRSEGSLASSWRWLGKGTGLVLVAKKRLWAVNRLPDGGGAVDLGLVFFLLWGGQQGGRTGQTIRYALFRRR